MHRWLAGWLHGVAGAMAIVLMAMFSGPAVAETDSLHAEVRHRERAALLVRELATVDEADLPRVERELAELGPAAMVALRLGELADSFEVRRRSRTMADRVRWRLVASAELIERQPELLATMAGEHARARAAVVDAVSTSPPATALPFLRECLTDAQAYVRHRAVDGLANLARQHAQRKAEVVAVLETTLTARAERDLQILGISALTRLEAADVDRLAPLLRHEALEVRRSAIRAMGFSGDGRAVAHIFPRLDDPQWQVRAAALEALQELSGKLPNRNQVGQRVLALLEDEDGFVRAKAVGLLAKLKYVPAVPHMLAAMDAGQMEAPLALAALASMQAPAGRDRLIQRVAADADLQARARWLELLGSYRDDAQVLALFRRLLGNDQDRAVWPAAIEAVGHRAEFAPLVVNKITDEDDDIARAAWAAAFYHLDEHPLNERQLAALWQASAAERRSWVLHYSFAHQADPEPWLLKALALAEPEPERVNLALGMLGKLHADDALEVPGMPSRHTARHDPGMVHRQQASPPSEARASTAADHGAWQAPVEALLKHADAEVATRAAALLYRTGVQDPPVVQRLRAALQSDQPHLQRLGLAAMAADAKPLRTAVELEPLAQNAATRARAVDAMVATGDERYLPLLIELAEQMPRDDHGLTAALLAFGGEAALTAAAARAASVSAWEARELVTALAGMSGPEPVQIVQMLWDRKDLDGWERGEMVPTLLTLDDPSVQPMLEATMQLARQREIWIDMAPVQARLRELDPEASARSMLATLKAGDLEAQHEAITALLEVAPNAQLVAGVLEAAQATPVGPPEWRMLAEWLPEPAVYEHYLPAFDRLNEQLRLGLAQRLTRTLDEDGLDAVLKLAPAGEAARTLLAMVVADRLRRHPDHGPPLQGQPTEALVLLLEASAHQPDGLARVTPYLADKREAVAAAAGRGLALHLLGHRLGDAATGLDALQRERLVTMAASNEPYTAYLAAEALLHFDPAALRELEPERLATDAAALRAVAAHVGEARPAALTGRLRMALRGDRGPTITRLALAALAADESGEAGNASRLVAEGRMVYEHGDLMRELALRDGEPAVLATLLEHGLLNDQSPALLARLAGLRETAREGGMQSDQLFALLARRGHLTSTGAEDMLRLLRMMDRGERHYHGPWQLENDGGGHSLLSTAIAWAGDEPDEQVVAHMSERSLSGVGAAVVAAIAWEHEAAGDLLLQVATAARGRGAGNMQQQLEMRQVLALQSLEVLASPAQLDALVEYEATLVGERYDFALQMLRDLVHRVLAVHRPAYVRELLEQRPPSSSPSPWEAGGPTLDALQLQAADDAAWPEQVTAGAERTALLRHVLQARQAETGDGPAGTDWEPLLPPWGAGPTSLGEAGALVDGPALQERAQREWRQWRQAILGTEAVDDDSHPLDNAYFHAEVADERAGSFGQPSSGGHGSWSGDPAYVLSEPDPAGYYLEQPSSGSVVPLVLPQQELAERLEPLVNHKVADVRRRALRTIAHWQVTPLADRVASRLAADDKLERMEATWALGRLRGQAAVAAVRSRFDASDDLDERIVLAVVLRLLGETEAGQAEFTEAAAVGRIVRLQHRALTIPAPGTATRRGGGLLSRLLGGGEPHPQAEQEHYRLINQLRDGEWVVGPTPWANQLAVVANDQAHAHQRALTLRSNVLPSVVPALALRVDLDRLFIDSTGRITPARPVALPLPVTPRSTTSPREAPPFARLMAAEQHLEALVFVQFAHEAEDLLDLRDRWRRWWHEHADAGREAWWRQAVGQALVELDDERWWHRTRGAARLARLTGRTAGLANPFSAAEWARYAEGWRAWWATAQTHPPHTTLMQLGVEAGVLDPRVPPPADATAVLALLVRLAGEARPPLAEAALLQLVGWPDATALQQAALRWQTSPRPHLAVWAREQARAASGRFRLMYDASQLPKSAGPAGSE